MALPEHLGHRSWQEQCMMGEGDEGKTRGQPSHDQYVH